MNIAIVLAKGADKGEANINLFLVENHPLIYYSINAALNSEKIDKVVVTTDDKKIEEIAEGFACPVVKRPKRLKSMGEAIVHSAREIVKENPSCKNIIILSGNNTMVSSYLIEKSIDVLERRKEIKSVTTVWKAKHDHPNRALILKDKFLKPFLEISEKRDIYFQDGSVYAVRVEVIEDKCFKEKRWWAALPNCVALVRPWPTGRDIHDSYGLNLGRWWLKNALVDTAQEVQ